MYEELLHFLELSGYEVDVYTHKTQDNQEYLFYLVSGKGIYGGFCTPNSDSYTYINGSFAADHIDCFDKWAKCPLVVKLPCDLASLKKNLDFLGSLDGYNHSNFYEYLDKRILPYEID
jgi:hypothetical protein